MVVSTTADTEFQSDDSVLYFSTSHEALCNWSAHKVRVWSLTFQTAEHAYQYRKFIDTDPAWARRIKRAKSPWEAKLLSRQRNHIHPEWDNIRVKILREILAAKLAQHEDIQELLYASRHKAIVDCTPGHPFWATDKRSNGANMRGKLWMSLRDELLNS
jgi:ribA/ribD-fused uncharacterized protein